VDEWNIPQLSPEEATGPKIGSGLAKAVNAAVSVKSKNESMGEIAKRYNRPENCSYLKAPKVNEEIWEAMNKMHIHPILLCKKFKDIWLKV
jgi:hypothetical protein